MGAWELLIICQVLRPFFGAHGETGEVNEVVNEIIIPVQEGDRPGKNPWCPPCVKEVPNLKKLYAEYKDKGFEIIGISMDWDKKKLDDYLKENGVTWPIVSALKAWDDETRELYGVKSIPSTWLVDRNGVLRYFGLEGEALKKAVKELLTQSR